MNREDLLNEFYALNAMSKQLRDAGASQAILQANLLCLAEIAKQLAESQ